MFEDSTFESTGKIHTHSRSWMTATFLLNGSILLALILIPLIYPEALPPQCIPFLVTAPTPTPPQQPDPPTRLRVAPLPTEIPDGHVVAPLSFPREPFVASTPEPVPFQGIPGLDSNAAGSENATEILRGQARTPIVRAGEETRVHVPSTVEMGLLLQKTVPQYPPVGRAMRAEGTVVLEATISKAGMIENLRVVSGPPVLRQAALDAVKTWIYKPYKLNGEPVEVETTVNVVFSLAR